MNNYKIVDSCGNCKNCLMKSADYDDLEYHFCNLKKDFPKRMGDVKIDNHNFRNWKMNNEIEENGVCDKHERIADGESLRDCDVIWYNIKDETK